MVTRRFALVSAFISVGGSGAGFVAMLVSVRPLGCVAFAAHIVGKLRAAGPSPSARR